MLKALCNQMSSELGRVKAMFRATCKMFQGGRRLRAGKRLSSRACFATISGRQCGTEYIVLGMEMNTQDGPETHLPKAQECDCSLREPPSDYNSQMPSAYGRRAYSTAQRPGCNTARSRDLPSSGPRDILPARSCLGWC